MAKSLALLRKRSKKKRTSSSSSSDGADDGGIRLLKTDAVEEDWSSEVDVAGSAITSIYSFFLGEDDRMDGDDDADDAANSDGEDDTLIASSVAAPDGSLEGKEGEAESKGLEVADTDDSPPSAVAGRIDEKSSTKTSATPSSGPDGEQTSAGGGESKGGLIPRTIRSFQRKSKKKTDTTTEAEVPSKSRSKDAKLPSSDASADWDVSDQGLAFVTPEKVFDGARSLGGTPETPSTAATAALVLFDSPEYGPSPLELENVRKVEGRVSSLLSRASSTRSPKDFSSFGAYGDLTTPEGVPNFLPNRTEILEDDEIIPFMRTRSEVSFVRAPPIDPVVAGLLPNRDKLDVDESQEVDVKDYEKTIYEKKTAKTTYEKIAKTACAPAMKHRGGGGMFAFLRKSKSVR